MNKTLKKYLITATTLAMLALVVLLCIFPYQNAANKSPLNLTNTSTVFDDDALNIQKSNGVIRRFDGLLTEGEKEENAKGYKDGSSAIRSHRVLTSLEKETWQEINNAAMLKVFLENKDGLQKTKGILTADIYYGDSKLNNYIFSKDRVLDGNGYSVLLKGVVENGTDGGGTDDDLAAFTDIDDTKYDKNYYRCDKFFGQSNFGDNVYLVAAGYLVGINEGTISNLTIEYDSYLKIPATKSEYPSETAVTRSNSAAPDRINCVGIMAGINVGTINNVCVDINDPLIFKKPLNGEEYLIKHNTAFVGGLTALAGRKSVLTRATVNNYGGVACYTKAKSSMSVVGGVVGNVATGNIADSVADSVKIMYISVQGTGAIESINDFVTDNWRNIAGGIIGGAMTINVNLRPRIAGEDYYGDYVTNTINKATLSGFASAWKGVVKNNATVEGSGGAGGQKGPQIGMPFGRIHPRVDDPAYPKIIANSCLNVMLLFDYGVNGTRQVTTWYGGNCIDMDNKLNIWNEAYATDATEAKGKVSAGFDYEADFDGAVVYAVGIAKDADKTTNAYTGASNTLTREGGMVWSVTTGTYQPSGDDTDILGTSISTDYSNLHNIVSNFGGSFDSRKYLYEFGEVVSVEYEGDLVRNKTYHVNEPIAMPKVKVKSAIETDLIDYNTKISYNFYRNHIKYTTPSNKLVTLSTGKGEGYNGGAGKTILPGKYQIRTFMDKDLQVYYGGKASVDLGYFDKAGKIIALNKTGIVTDANAYNYELTTRKITTNEPDPVGWVKSYDPTFRIDNMTIPEMVDGFEVVVNGKQSFFDLTGKYELEYHFTQTSGVGGASIKFTPYKNFSYMGADGSVVTERVPVAEVLTKSKIYIDSEAPTFLFDKGDMYKTFNYYEYDEDAEGHKGAEIPNFDRNVWRESAVVVEYTVTDNASGLDVNVAPDNTITKTLVFLNDKPIIIEYADNVGNVMSKSLSFKVDQTDLVIIPKLKGFTTNGTAYNKASIMVQCTAGSAGAKLEFYCSQGEFAGTWQPVKDKNGNADNIVNNETRNFEISLNFNVIKATLRVRLVSNSDEKGTVYAGKHGIAITKASNDENAVITHANGITKEFSITLYKFRVRLDKNTIQFSSDGGSVWEYMSAYDDYTISTMMNKQYDGKNTSKIMFRPQVAVGHMTENITMSSDDELELPIDWMSRINNNVSIQGKYNQIGVGQTEFVFTGKNSELESIVEFWDGSDVNTIKKEMSLNCNIVVRPINVNLNLLDENAFKTKYFYGDEIVTTFQYMDSVTGDYFAFEVVTDAKKGANASVDPYPIQRVFVKDQSGNFEINISGSKSITIAPKPISVDATLDGQDIAGDIPFDGKARAVYGYYKDLKNKKVDAIVKVFMVAEDGTRTEVQPFNGKSYITAMGKYEVEFSVADSNYVVKDYSAKIGYTVKTGRLNINEEQQIIDYTTLEQFYNWKASFPSDVIGSGLFNEKNIKISYYKYGDCKLDTTVPTNPKWVLTSPSAIPMTELPKDVGGYKIEIVYTNPTNMEADGVTPIPADDPRFDATAGNFINLTYNGTLIIKKALTELSVAKPELHLPWNGEFQTFDMTKADVALYMSKVMIKDKDGNITFGKKKLFDVSNDSETQPTELIDYLYSMISVEFKNKADTAWIKVFAWDVDSQKFIKTNNYGAVSEINNDAIVPGTFRIVFRGGANFDDSVQYTYLKIVNRSFGYEDPTAVAKSQSLVYDEKGHSIVAQIPDANPEASITYFYDNKSQNEPFVFTDAGVYNQEILISGDKYFDYKINVTLSIAQATFGKEDIFVQGVLEREYDGLRHSPTILGEGVTVGEDGEYYYHGSRINYISPGFVDITSGVEGIETKYLNISTINHTASSFAYNVHIKPMQVDVTYDMDAKYAGEFLFKNLQLASYKNVDGTQVKCRVKFFDKGTGAEAQIDATTKMLPKGTYYAQIVLDTPNYAVKEGSAGFEFSVGAGKSNLGLIIGCSVGGGVVVLGGGIALTVVLILKKKKVAKI